MSMTREEAINWIENLRNRYSKQAEEYEKQGALIPMDAMYPYIQALGVAISALRPVSRERVEKVWRGCNNCRTCDSCAYRYIKAEEEPCWSCNTNIYSNYKPEPNRKFCPACGAPMTDEAVQMVMERLEALHGDL